MHALQASVRRCRRLGNSNRGRGRRRKMSKPLTASLKRKGGLRFAHQNRPGFSLGESDDEAEGAAGAHSDVDSGAVTGQNKIPRTSRPLIHINDPIVTTTGSVWPSFPPSEPSADMRMGQGPFQLDPLDAFMADLQGQEQQRGRGRAQAPSGSSSSKGHATQSNTRVVPRATHTLQGGAAITTNYVTPEDINNMIRSEQGYEHRHNQFSAASNNAAGVVSTAAAAAESTLGGVVVVATPIDSLSPPKKASPQRGSDSDEEDGAKTDFLQALKAYVHADDAQQPSSSLGGDRHHRGDDDDADDADGKSSSVVSPRTGQGQGEAHLKNEPSATAQSDLGIVYGEDGDVFDEDEQHGGTGTGKTALELLEAHKKGKELRPVDHSSLVYLPFRKNLYIVPRALVQLSEEEVQVTRDILDVKVRGRGCPAPVSSWEQCGLSERILKVLENAHLVAPFAIQQQAIPAIMAGRDVIGVAKTGSGKTLAFLLPMFRHILDQPPLTGSDGPIGLIMAPARELAFQIHNEAKRFTKTLGLRIACIYGGAGVAEQIAELKRQPHIVVCTPGRMIDILCMHAGRLLSLQRVTMVVMDEADRMFDMGFEPQIKMIMQNIRPDRQTILFSATFPKVIERLARAVLSFPLEIQVGERSTVNKDITQVIEVHEEPDKFLRLLQLLGIYYEKGNVLIFVDKQEKCDQLFADLLRAGYPCLSLHGGIDQVDRDHTLKEFKTRVKTVMVATGVAGRGLDVPEIVCVVNYSCPNHLEDYVHRVGRTGRAGRKGTAYTFLSRAEEAYAPIMCKVLKLVSDEIPPELAALRDSFQSKVKAGQAKWSLSGFVGKGYTFDATEMNESQKLSSQQRKAYEIEQGIADSEKAAAAAAAAIAEAGAGDADGETSAMRIDQTTTGGSKSSSEGGVSKLGPYAQLLIDLLALVRSKSSTVIKDASLPVVNNGSKLYISAPILKEDGTIDIKAAAYRARVIAQLILEERSRKGAEALALHQKADSYYQEILDINDYPPQARMRVTQAGKGLDRVQDSLGVNVVSKGSYRPPGKAAAADPNNPGLQLIIEGSNSMQVKKARAEIVRLLDIEVMHLGAGGGGGGGGQALQGRYSVT